MTPRKSGTMKKRIMTIALAGLLNTSLCEARLDGIPYLEVEIKGKKYEVPAINAEAKNDLYYLKKALAGDAAAREVFLGGQDKRAYFIGDGDAYRWLYVTPNDEWIAEGKGKGEGE